MKKISLLTFCLFLLPTFIAKAEYLSISGSTGIIDETYNGCTENADGTISSNGTTTLCQVKFAIILPAGTTLSDITAFYYDNSGSQFFYIGFLKEALTSDSYSSLKSSTDTSTSSSIQSTSLSYGSSLSSSYTYFVYVTLGYSTELRGILVGY